MTGIDNTLPTGCLPAVPTTTLQVWCLCESVPRDPKAAGCSRVTEEVSTELGLGSSGAGALSKTSTGLATDV